MNAPRDASHDETVVALLKADPNFANTYLAAALDEAELPANDGVRCCNATSDAPSSVFRSNQPLAQARQA